MRVLFYEPNHTGHHFAYLARMLPGFIELPVEVALATTPEAVASHEFEMTLKQYEDRIEVLPSCRPLIKRAPLRNSWRRCADLASVVKQWKPDHVCVVYADGIWQVLSATKALGFNLLPQGPTYEAWMYRGGFTYPDATSRRQQRNKRLFQRFLKQGVFARIHFDDELVLEFTRRLPPTPTEVVLPPNPVRYAEVPSRDDARRRLDLPREATIVSCLGMADHRKGVHLAMAAIQQLASTAGDRPHVRLFIGGPQSDAIRELLTEPVWQNLVEAGTILTADRFLSEQDMLDAAAASDLLLAPYFKHSGRSSIILWAAAVGRPVVAVDRGCIRYVVEHEQLGAVCNVEDAEVFASAIRLRLEQPWTDEDRQRVRKYAQWHSIENYQQLCSACVRQRLEAGQ
ncbi:glycosyltransferase [Aeoliella sp.]|uniref:glycosyltransferase n=1 Tax=Aeoliella sp. TaxID=2795800 RepID=UPI003CCBEAE5